MVFLPAPGGNRTDVSGRGGSEGSGVRLQVCFIMWDAQMPPEVMGNEVWVLDARRVVDGRSYPPRKGM